MSQQTLIEETFNGKEPEPPVEPTEPIVPPAEPPAEPVDPVSALEGVLGGKESKAAESTKAPAEPVDSEPPAEPVDSEPPAEPNAPAIVNMTEELFEKVTSSHEEFGKFMNETLSKIQDDSRKDYEAKLDDAKQDMMKKLPEVVQSSQQRVMTITEAAKDFYADFPSLNDKPEYVIRTTNAIMSENPEWTPKQVLARVGELATKELGIAQDAKQREQQRTTSPKPVFAGEGGRRSPGKSVDNRTPQQKLMDETFR